MIVQKSHQASSHQSTLTFGTQKKKNLARLSDYVYHSHTFHKGLDLFILYEFMLGCIDIF